MAEENLRIMRIMIESDAVCIAGYKHFLLSGITLDHCKYISSDITGTIKSICHKCVENG